MRILIAVDRSEYADIVVQHGLDQAVREGAEDIHVVTAVETDEDRAAARAWLDELTRDLIESFGCTDRRFTLHVPGGRTAPAIAIATLASELVPDLLVIGRFHEPSSSEGILELVHCPTLVVGVEGHLLEPQCLTCQAVRRDTDGEQLFCEAHAGVDVPHLMDRLPSSSQLGSRMW